MDENSTIPRHFDLTGQVAIHGYMPDFTGNYSCVYRGILQGNLVAVKIIKATGMPEAMKRKVMRERAIWASMNHPNIHPFYGFADDSVFGPFGALVSPWSAKGDAGKLMSENGERMLISERLKIWKGVIDGVVYLHDQTSPIVHGDLKPGNVLINHYGFPTICDFGLARIFLEQGSTGLTTTSEHTGTTRYLAPELVASNVTVYPTLASDVYALGCLGLEFIYLQQPFANHVNNLRGQIFRDLRKGLPPAVERPQQAWPSLRAWPILVKCWNSDPASRPSAFSAAYMFSHTDFTLPLAVMQKVAQSAELLDTINYVGQNLVIPTWWDRCEGLLNLCLVSKSFRAVATPFLYQAIRLNIKGHLESLQSLNYALESVPTQLLLSLREPYGYVTCTKSIVLSISERGPYHRDLSVAIRNLVNRLPGLRYTCISSDKFYAAERKVGSLTTLAFYQVELDILFDHMPIIHMLESMQRLSIHRCHASVNHTPPSQGTLSRVYLPSLLEIALEGNIVDLPVYTSNLFGIISNWTMPRLRSLEFYYHARPSRSLDGLFTFIRTHGQQLQHLTLSCQQISGQDTSDLLHLCSSLRSFDMAGVLYPALLFQPRIHLENGVFYGPPLSRPHMEKFKVVIKQSGSIGGLIRVTSLMRAALISFPNLVEAEIILINSRFPQLPGVKASFLCGDKFITCWAGDKKHMYDREDTVSGTYALGPEFDLLKTQIIPLEVTGDSDIRG